MIVAGHMMISKMKRHVSISRERHLLGVTNSLSQSWGRTGPNTRTFLLSFDRRPDFQAKSTPTGRNPKPFLHVRISRPNQPKTISARPDFKAKSTPTGSENATERFLHDTLIVVFSSCPSASHHSRIGSPASSRTSPRRAEFGSGPPSSLGARHCAGRRLPVPCPGCLQTGLTPRMRDRGMSECRGARRLAMP